VPVRLGRVPAARDGRAGGGQEGEAEEGEDR